MVDLAARHGITRLAYASPGRLRGHIADDRDLFDMFEFQRAATDLVGAEITCTRTERAQRPCQPRPGHRRSPVTGDARPDRHALLELQALLTEMAALRSEGNADRFTADARL